MWPYSGKNRQDLYFLVEICTKRVYPLNQFQKQLSAEEDIPGPYPQTKFHRCHSENVGLQPPKLQKLEIFGINLLLKQFFKTKFGLGRESQFRTLVPNFVTVG